MSTVVSTARANLAHVSISTTDIDASRQFYSETLGFTEISRPDFGFPGIWYDIDGSIQLHIIQSDPAEGGIRTLSPTNQFSPRDPHFALFTNNIEGVAQHLKQLDVEVDELHNSPTSLHQLFVRDPDGNMIEFIGPEKAHQSRANSS